MRRAVYLKRWPRARDRIIDGAHERCCNHCDEWIWIQEFERNKWCHLGRTAECNLCGRARRARYEIDGWQLKDFSDKTGHAIGRTAQRGDLQLFLTAGC